jgi:predicted RNase H-like HicB family nuclease
MHRPYPAPLLGPVHLDAVRRVPYTWLMSQSTGGKTYKAVVHAEGQGGYWAEVPELPGCFTQGDTLDEIYRNLTEAIACHLGDAEVQGRIGLLEIAA